MDFRSKLSQPDVEIISIFVIFADLSKVTLSEVFPDNVEQDSISNPEGRGFFLSFRGLSPSCFSICFPLDLAVLVVCALVVLTVNIRQKIENIKVVILKLIIQFFFVIIFSKSNFVYSVKITHLIHNGSNKVCRCNR